MMRRDQADLCAAHAGGCMLRNPYCGIFERGAGVRSMRNMCAAWRGPVRLAGYRWFAGRTAGRARILFRAIIRHAARVAMNRRAQAIQNCAEPGIRAKSYSSGREPLSLPSSSSY